MARTRKSAPSAEHRQASVEARANEFAASFLSRYRFEPNLFATEILQIKLDPWQIEANDAIADYVRASYGEPVKLQDPDNIKRWFTVRAMHGPGKTFWGAQLIMWFGSVFPDARIPCIAPKLDQLKTRLWLEIRRIRNSATADFQRMTEDIGSTHLRWFGQSEWVAFGQTAARAENLSGIHNDFLLIFVDEASGVAEALFPTIFGALSTGKILILVMISNPTKKTGTFAASWLKPSVSPQYWPIAITLDKAPRVSRTWVQQMVQRYGEQSPIVKMRCYGEFADDSPFQLIATSWVSEALAREIPELETTAKLRVSVDVADGGEDETVITAARVYSFGRVVLQMRRFSFETSVAPIKTAEAAEQIFAAFAGTKGVDEFAVDGLGVGAGTAGTLILRKHRVVVHKGGEASSDQAKWRNRRVQNYCALRDAMREGRLYFAEGWADDADAEELQAQLASVEMNPATDRVDDLVTKEQMKAQGLKSPDMGDSLSMQYSSAQQAQQGLQDFVRLAAKEAAQRGKVKQPALTETHAPVVPRSAPPPVVTTTIGSLADAFKRQPR